MTERILYRLQDLRRSCGQHEGLAGITLSFYEGAKIALIGRDAAAKSTLLQIIAGEDTEFEGSAEPADDEVSIGYLSLEPSLNEELTVQGSLEEAVQHLRDVEARYDEACMDMEGREDEFQQLQDFMDHHDVWNLESRLEQVTGALCLPPPEADVTTLSAGERRRVALCKLLLAQPDILLLDEPTQHLDAATAKWLEQHLHSYPGLVMLIAKDPFFVHNVVGWILEVEHGKCTVTELEPRKFGYDD